MGDLAHRIQITPLSARAEFANAVRFAAVVVAGLWIVLAAETGTGRGGTSRNLLPYQALVQDRPFAEQRIFRELQEGLLEAERQRVETGRWPTPDALAEDGVPPFAEDPTAATRATWRVIVDGLIVNYMGVPLEPGQPVWLVSVQEPDPAAPPDPAREDEEHHKLLNGAMLHVATWLKAGVRIPTDVVRSPAAEGWTQLRAVGPTASDATSAGAAGPR